MPHDDRASVAPEVASATGMALREVTRWRDGRREPRREWLAEEVPVAIHCNGHPVAVMMASPGDLEDFGRGFALTEGLVDQPGQLHGIHVRRELERVELAMTLAEPQAERLRDRVRLIEGRSGCGLCGNPVAEDVLRLPAGQLPVVCVRADAIARAMVAMAAQQRLNQATGAVHAAAWCRSDGEIHLVREDIGRHNAMDKVIGARWGETVFDTDGFAVVTSRASYEIVLKAARAGIAAVAAVSAPTAMAVALAQTCGLLLVGFARGSGCTVYTFPERLITP
ncbi:formate dehydrogenase accessory sulfurtransferase FdhD [Tahibacter amnicola]|uniref:Sulfur carrier protein FdhD n=1 Tax=Tahibacter amnicola TaxID=2976241 RepID=A0ABY6BCU9_9GAMM|nr:formate dehydrogenase accessory sulfurtransferase FdhD [Tahibacter amnicola]UXI67864.1 formate dehydrogenase accessory sulfurtransferase FdhD [Tahibacter amnicola]